MRRASVVIIFFLCLSTNFFDGVRFGEKQKWLQEKNGKREEVIIASTAKLARQIAKKPEVVPSAWASEVQVASIEIVEEEKKYDIDGPCFGRNLHKNHRQFISALGYKIPEMKMSDVEALLSVPNVCDNPEVLKAKKTWAELEREMMDEISIGRGVRFYFDNRGLLDEVSKHFGVRPSVLVSLTRIESDLGQNLGKYPVILVLYNQYFHTKNRTSAVNRTRVWLEYAENVGVPVLSHGSHAGAFGLTQFMPQSSSLYYTTDWDGNGVANLYEIPDAVASSANYLKKHGWGKYRELDVLNTYNRSKGQKYAKIVLAYDGAIRHIIE